MAKRTARKYETIAPPSGSGPRELIVIVKPESKLRIKNETVTSAVGAKVSSFAEVIKNEGIALTPLFGLTEERLELEASMVAATTGEDVPNLSIYYKVDAPDEQLDSLAKKFLKNELVEAAYVKPPGEPPQGINDMLPTPEDAPPITPDFTNRQSYLEVPPGGIDARYAWTLAGGGGAGTRVIDLEWGWRFSHEDLLQNQGGIVGGTGSTSDDHGTAVISVIGGDRNSIGVTGIAPDANVSAVAFSMPTAAAIRLAADRLGPGDIILLEIHRPGPRATGIGQQGFIAIEWWPDDFDAIRYAFSRGIIVVEAAGNGAQNLDDPIYNTPAAGFPASWTNPFNRANRDSGAIVVGAGAPPQGTHGADHGPDRSRLDFSNYGALIDAQGWGREVTACGYGDLQAGTNKDIWYTDRFSGTSSASPIVVGALASVQGILRARGATLLTPTQARKCLRSTGSAQQDAPGRPQSQRIGNRPNIRQFLNCAQGKPLTKEFIKEKELKERPKEFIKERKEFVKEGKEFVKEAKDKDIKELKEKDRKEFKEFKELKEKDRKEIFEKGPKEFEGRGGGVIQPETSSLENFNQRIERLESAVDQLTHFISSELRPDLTMSALSNESDLETLSAKLQQEAEDAKRQKDNKDIEKMRER